MDRSPPVKVKIISQYAWAKASPSALSGATPDLPRAMAPVLQGQEGLQKVGTAALVELAADVVQHWFIKMLDEPVKVVFHLEVDDDVRVFLEVHGLHLQHFGAQRSQLPQASVRSSSFSRSAVACSSKTFATASGVSKGMRRFLMSPKEKPRCFRDRI